MSKSASEHHKKAAEHHEHAANHHKHAANHHEEGNHEKRLTTPILRMPTQCTQSTTRQRQPKLTQKSTEANSSNLLRTERSA